MRTPIDEYLEREKTRQLIDQARIAHEVAELAIEFTDPGLCIRSVAAAEIDRLRRERNEAITAWRRESNDRLQSDDILALCRASNESLAAELRRVIAVLEALEAA